MSYISIFLVGLYLTYVDAYLLLKDEIQSRFDLIQKLKILVYYFHSWVWNFD